MFNGFGISLNSDKSRPAHHSFILNRDRAIYQFVLQRVATWDIKQHLVTLMSVMDFTHIDIRSIIDGNIYCVLLDDTVRSVNAQDWET